MREYYFSFSKGFNICSQPNQFSFKLLNPVNCSYSSIINYKIIYILAIIESDIKSKISLENNEIFFTN